ncbi:hypothetical protein SAMN04487968_109197 [Nocardioides terrae]|uniref:Uncharacterized protein n=1 Tax=Nocardioides terrae TaxID=574651 RepID=A0A1I1L9S9_9ACTN|nr:hypothetical protein [Nocardioides terrae]SFC69262.1 hypothetical protein SAMN04487968_109197 [Nocardioides terrae]
MPITDRARAHTARRLLTAAAVSLGLVVTATPAVAAEPTPAQFAAMGSTSAPPYTLPAGCHWYSYSYRITPPEPEWSLEVLVTDAAGVAQASDVILSGADATSGTKRFQLCASNTAAPGVFTIRGHLTYRHYATMPIVDQTQDYSGWIATSHFRVTKPGTAHHRSAKCAKARKRAGRLDTRKARRAAHRACRRR